MIFEKGLKCVQKPQNGTLLNDDNGDGDEKDFNWFPTDLIVDMKTYKINIKKKKYNENIIKNSIINYGKKPDCDLNDADSTVTNSEKQIFNFLLYDDSRMDVYVSTNKSLHHYSHAYYFPIVEENDVEADNEKENFTILADRDSGDDNDTDNNYYFLMAFTFTFCLYFPYS